MKNHGLIPTVIERTKCYFWRGHDYKIISPEDNQGRNLIECIHCGKRKVTWVLP